MSTAFWLAFKIKKPVTYHTGDNNKRQLEHEGFLSYSHFNNKASRDCKHSTPMPWRYTYVRENRLVPLTVNLLYEGRKLVAFDCFIDDCDRYPIARLLNVSIPNLAGTISLALLCSSYHHQAMNMNEVAIIDMTDNPDSFLTVQHILLHQPKLIHNRPNTSHNQTLVVQFSPQPTLSPPLFK